METYSMWIEVSRIVIGLLIAAAVLLAITRRLQDHSRELDELKSQVLEWNRRLEEKVAERTEEVETAHLRLEETYIDTVEALMEAVTAKDPYLLNHSRNVAAYAKAIAEELGFPKQRIHRLTHGCELHDLGKIAIPDSILLKPGPLTPEEYAIMKQHPTWGARILQPLSLMRDITEMVHQEHERWDGKGYPNGLQGEQILLEARIIAVADSFDAMTSNRIYRRRLSLESACEELANCAGTQFDPRIVAVCLRAIREGKLTIASSLHHDEVLEKAYRRVSDPNGSPEPEHHYD